MQVHARSFTRVVQTKVPRGAGAAAAQPVLPGMSIISYGLADAKSKKGEDAPSVKPQSSASSIAAYAIFDGHGGKPFAHTCAHLTEAGIDHGSQYDVLDKLIAAGGGLLPSDAAVDEIFWNTDAEVGKLLATLEQPNMGGCTAQILMVLPSAGGGMQLLQAWVGDSTALTVDMRSGKVLHDTFNHNPDMGDEAVPLLHMAAVNKACRRRQKKERKKESKKQAKEAMKAAKKAAAAAGEGGGGDGAAGAADDADEEEGDDENDGDGDDDEDDKKKDDYPCPPDALIREVLTEMQHPDTSDGHISSLRRAFERERTICGYLPGSGKYRRNCFIYRRPREKDENMPMTVHTTEDPFRGKHADMMMTRSLGDWKHVAWILPTPQVERHYMRATQHWRVVIASDGLWDVVSHERCAELTRESATCQEAAEALVEEAKKVYLGERALELPGDDTTVLVVELNPSNKSYTQPGSGGGGAGCGCNVV